jgi:Tol biopolymer transport system component
MPLDANSGKPGGPPKQVTDEGDYVGNPCLTSDGKLLVYSTSRTGNPDVMLKNLETGSVTPVAATGDLEAFPRILPDGSAVFYDVRRSPNDRSVNVADMKTGVTRRVCDRCGVWGVSPHGEWVLGRFVGTGQTIGLTDTNTGKTIEFIKKEGARAYQPNLSDDGKWIVFLLKMGPQHGRLYVAPFRGATPIPEREWIPVTRDDTGLDKPRWSPNAQLLYYTSEKDGFRCIYAQKLDARKNPVGEAFGVYHPHSARLSMSGVPLSPLEISVAKNRIAFMLKETTGNVWLADLGAKE